MLSKSSTWQQEKQILEVLSSLSYQQDDIQKYLHKITIGVSELLNIDWSVVTIFQNGLSRVIASNIHIGEAINQTYSLHGTLAETVITTGETLVLGNVQNCDNLGAAPPGYQAYLGIPLCTPHNQQVIGTICSFHREPRDFTPEEIQLAKLFGDRAATAIDNYYLYQQQLQFNQTLEAEVAKRTEELKQAQGKLIEQARLAAIGEFTAGIIHEIRNPLTTIKMGLNSLTKLDLVGSARERLSLALEESGRLERLLQSILLYAKPQTLNLETINICELITQVLPILQEMPEANQRLVKFNHPNLEILVELDRDKFKQVLINTVRNACEAIAENQLVSISVDENPQTQQIICQVHNFGSPIPPEILVNITQPFYSTKPSGTGLGLALCQRIMDAHQGKLSIVSSQSEGTKVQLSLPKPENGHRQ